MGSGNISGAEEAENKILKTIWKGAEGLFFEYKNDAYRSGKSGERNHMEFTPINTQEEFDAAIKSRLQRERDTVSKQYADYDRIKEDLQKLTDEKAAFESSAKETAEKMKDLNDQLAAANTKIKGYEVDRLKTSAALSAGIPMELKDRLTGETEEEITKDAASLAKLFKQQKNKNIPSFEQDEGTPASDEARRRSEFKALAKKLRKEE